MKTKPKHFDTYLIGESRTQKIIGQVKASSVDKALDRAIAKFPGRAIWVQQGIAYPPMNGHLTGE